VGVSLTSYERALAGLFARTTGVWKFGLERTLALLHRLGDPQRDFPIYHVAGTNGKGSVVANLDALLRGGGWRVARYTSPHLVDFSERIVVDGAAVDRDWIVDWIAKWTPEVERLGATFFEATTAMAFEYFAARGADVAVVEVGLGGRTDATNVVTPLVAGVTSIGLDHTEYLGTTVEQIAAEKAGIFKPGRPAIIGERDPSLAHVLVDRARAVDATPIRALVNEERLRDIDVSASGTSFTIDRGDRAVRLHSPLVGAHQAANASLALAMIEAGGEPFARVLDRAAELLDGVHLPGRFEQRGRFIFDVAHNPAGTTVLSETLELVQPPRPIHALLAVLADKDWRAMMGMLAAHVDAFILTMPPTAPVGRAWPLDQAARYATTLGKPVVCEPDFDRALERASHAPTTLVTGSFHTVGDAMARLQHDPLAG
jgi:dihydrofolate synthase / folylpolyglutamate synthase